MSFFSRKHSLFIKTVAVIAVCFFFWSDISFGMDIIRERTYANDALSAVCRFNPIGLDNFDVLDEDILQSSDVKEAFHGEISAVYASILMGKILNGWGAIMSAEAIQTIVAPRLAVLESSFIDSESFRKEGESFCVDYKDINGVKCTLRYYLYDKAADYRDVQRGIIINETVKVVIENKRGGSNIISPHLAVNSPDQIVTDAGKEEIEDDLFGRDDEYDASKSPKDLSAYLEGKDLVDGVFEGGGAKGTAYAGALEEVAEKNMWFEKVAGTSAGAITAALIAAGYTHEEIKKIVFETDFNKFKDWRWGFLPPVINLFLFGGLYAGRSFERWMAEKMAAKFDGVEPTMKDLQIPLTVVASDLTDRNMLVLNRDSAPDLKVSEAVRMSMGIPFFFNVFKWTGVYKKIPKVRRVVDGGLLSNLPLFNFSQDGESGKRVLGFMLHRVEGKKKKTFFGTILKAMENIPIIRILMAVINTAMDAYDNRQITKDSWATLINIPVNVGAIDFDLTMEQKEDLAERGKKATKKALEEDPADFRSDAAGTLSSGTEKDAEGRILVDGIFEGGGAKGVAYGGALEEFAERNVWFSKVAGTSAGAITAALIAAGHTHEEIKKIVLETDFNKFKDLRWGFLPPLINLAIFGGMYQGRAFERWMAEKLAAKFGGVEPTMKDLPMPLTVIASDISDEQILVLDRESAPDLKVSEAVRMSMGIPFFFETFKWSGSYNGKKKKRRVVDGGLLSNLPLFTFRQDGNDGNRPVFAFMFHRIRSEVKKGGLIKWVFTKLKRFRIVLILARVIQTALDAHDNYQIGNDKWAHFVDIPVDIGATDFDLTMEQKERLVEQGKETAKKALDKILSHEDVVEKELTTAPVASKDENVQEEVRRKGKIGAANAPEQEKPPMTVSADARVDATLSRPGDTIGQETDRKIQEFIDSLVVFAVEADLNKRGVLLAIDTSFIPEVPLQLSVMTGLLRALERMQIKNVTVCCGKGDALYREIASAREEALKKGHAIPKSNIVIVGKKEVLSSDVFKPLKADTIDEIGAFFANVIVPRDFPDDGDTRIIYIATQAIREASQYRRMHRMRDFDLDAEPLGIDNLIKSLELQTERISA